MRKPLVSMIVICYNSSKYILETLESAKNQTYENIELIISDDCSTDSTIQIVQNWVAKNKDRFKHVSVVQAKENTGISGNCNRGVLASSGEYIKPIAGDDRYRKNCVEDFVTFFQKNPDHKISAGKTSVFYNDDVDQANIWPKSGDFPSGLKRQKKEILKANFVYNVSIFFTRELYDLVGGFDETYSMFEDYPFDFKVIYQGYEIHLLNKIVVDYRVNFDSSTRPANDAKFANVRLQQDSDKFIRLHILKSLWEKKMLVWYILRRMKIGMIKRIVENGNFADKSKNWMTHKTLYVIKYVSSRLRRFENKRHSN